MDSEKRERAPRPVTRVQQRRRRGLLLRLAGWPMAGAGLLILGMLVSLQGQEALPWPHDGPDGFRVVIYGLAGWSLLLWGRRYARAGRQHMVTVLDSMDGLPAGVGIVLFLRSFVDDDGFAQQQTGLFAHDYLTTTLSEEEQLARALAPFGPMVGLGRPGDVLPPAGAVRHYASDHDWQAQVLTGLDQARLVVLAAGPGPSLRWEVEQIAARGEPDRLILVISRDVQQYQSFRESVGDLFPQGLPDYRPRPAALPPGAAAYTRAVVWFGPDWTPHLRHMDGNDFSGSQLHWVGTTFTHAIDEVYQRAGIKRPLLPQERLRRIWALLWTPVIRLLGVVVTVPEPVAESPPPRQVPQTQGSQVPVRWRVNRLRTGGLRHVFCLTDGTAHHHIEYRRFAYHTAVLLDGRRIRPHSGGEFLLPPGGPVLQFTAGLHLWADGQPVDTGDKPCLEQRAQAIRRALLACELPSAGSFGARLSVAPDIPLSAQRFGRQLAEPIIAVLRSRSEFGRATGWFTDRAMHIHIGQRSVEIGYSELAAPVRASHLTVAIGGREVNLPGHAAPFAAAFACVQEAIADPQPLPITRYVRAGQAEVRAVLSRGWSTTRFLAGLLFLPVGVLTSGALAWKLAADTSFMELATLPLPAAIAVRALVAYALGFVFTEVMVGAILLIVIAFYLARIAFVWLAVLARGISRQRSVGRATECRRKAS